MASAAIDLALRRSVRGVKVRVGEEAGVALYVPPERPWELRLRSKRSFKAQLDGVVRLWKLHAQARGDDAAQIDLSYVVRRLLESGIESAFSDYGHQPKSEPEWEALEASILSGVKKTSKAK